MRNQLKITILLTALAFTIGNAAATNLTWEDPDSSKNYQSQVTLNVTNSSVDNGDVSFQVKTPNSSNYNFFNDDSGKSVSSTDGFYWKADYSKGNGVSGDYDFRVNDSNGNFTELTGITLDTTDPSISSKSPEGDTNEESPKASFSTSDDDSGVNGSKTSIRVEDTDGDNIYAWENSSSSADLSDLSDEEYEVFYEVWDNSGNWINSSWTFTVDTSFDGDTDPSLNWDASETNNIVLMTEDVDLKMTFSGDDEEIESVTCYQNYQDSNNKGNEIDSDDKVNTNDGDYEFECEFSEDDYGGDEVDLTVEMCDEAGNCGTSNLGTFVFDDSDPTFTDMKTDINVVNDDFTVEYNAGDESGIEKLEYFYDDSNVDEGSGTSVNVTEDDDEFTANVSGLDEGNHTLYARVKDKVQDVDRWSTTQNIDIEYLPDAEPKLGLSVPDRFNVTAGENKTFDVTVENTGKLFISEVTVTSSGLGSKSADVVDLEAGEQVTVEMEVSSSESDIGWATVEVKSDNPETTESFDVRVNANQNQRDDVDSKLSDYQTKLQELKDRYSEMEGGLGDDLDEMADGNVSKVEQIVSQAQNEVDNNRYYKAQETLEGIEDVYSSADSSLTTVKEISDKRAKDRLMMMAIAGIVILGGGAGGFFYFSKDHDLHLERVIDSDISVTDTEGLMSRVKSIFSSEDEAEEFEWNGFK